MKILLSTTVFRAAVASALLLGLGSADVSAQPKKGKPAPLGMGAIQNAEKVTGKKMTSAQKSQIMAAARTRESNIDKARKAEWKKFRMRVAQTMGMSLAQMEAKEKAARAKKR